MGKAWAKQFGSEYRRTKLSLVVCILLILTINLNPSQQWFLVSLACIELLLSVNSVAWSKRSRVVLTFPSGLFEPLNLFPKILTLLERKVEYAFLKCLLYATEFCIIYASASPEQHIWSHKSRKETPELVNGDGIFVQNELLLSLTFWCNILSHWTFETCGKDVHRQQTWSIAVFILLKHWKTLKMTYL